MITINLAIPSLFDREDMTFSEFNQCADRNSWTGRACTDRLPGGGNDPREHDAKENEG